MFQIITFYKFLPLSDLEIKRDALKASMRSFSINGTIILADEGFNSTISGEEENIEAFLGAAQEIFGCDIDHKSSFHSEMPFRKIDVKIKFEIVTLKQKVDVSLGEGTHVEPMRWNELISDPETFVLDTRNDYEVMNGSFASAVNPHTEKFSELPDYAAENLDPLKHKRIAMYCTGGIRCEKFAPFLKSHGFENVYQLKGGILNYLAEVHPAESLWHGECFVFDDRRTVDHKLEKGSQKDHSQARKRNGGAK